MNGIVLSGGLGNQMFQYAFIATREDELFFLDKSGDKIELYKYFTLKHSTFYFIDLIFFNHSGFKLFFCHYLRNAFYKIIKDNFIDHTISISNLDDPLAFKIESEHILYNGFFQSPLYFDHKKSWIKKVFCLKKKISDLYKSRFSSILIKEKKVVVHVRRTDYTCLSHLDLGAKDLTLPASYYKNVLEKIHSPDNFYIFITDDPEFVNKEFKSLSNKVLSYDSAITDFQHMLHANTCIIANSTFSWWAAYLNNIPDKVVYCPRNFLGFKTNKEYPTKIYPKEWIQMDV